MSRQVVKFPRLEFRPELFNQLIDERGMTVTWEQATMCACVRADSTGQTSFSCGECANGSLYYAREDIVAVVTNITGQRNAAVYGEIAIGGLYVTTYGHHRLAINDRIILTHSTTRYAELATLGTAKLRTALAVGDTTLALDHTRRFPAPPLDTAGNPVMCYVRVGGQRIGYTGKTATALTGVPTTGTGAVTAAVAAGAAVQAEGYMARYAPQTLLDVRTTAHVYPASERRVEDRVVSFAPDVALPEGGFTMAYEAYPAYIVDSMGHEFRDQMLTQGYTQETLARFPVAVVARKDHLNIKGR